MSNIFEQEPFEKIVDIDAQRQRVAAEIKQQVLKNSQISAPETEHSGTNDFREALLSGDVAGLSGANFYNDPTWYDTPPPPKKVEGVAMRAAESQQQTREEQ